MDASEGFRKFDEESKKADYIKDLLIKEYMRDGLRKGFIPKLIPTINLMQSTFGIQDQSKAASYWYWTISELGLIGQTYERKKLNDEIEKEQYRKMREGSQAPNVDENTQGPVTADVEEHVPGQQTSNVDKDIQELAVKEYIADRIIKSEGKWPAPGLQSENLVQSSFQIDPELAHKYLMEVLDDFEEIGRKIAQLRNS